MTQAIPQADGRIEVRGIELFVLEGRLLELKDSGFQTAIPVRDGEDWVSWVTPPKPKAID